MNLLATLTSKIIAGLFVLALLLGLYVWATWDDSAQPKQDARSAKASAATAMETAQVVIDRSQSDQSIDELVNETSKAIENESDPKAAGDLARNAICKLLNNGSDPACELR